MSNLILDEGTPVSLSTDRGATWRHYVVIKLHVAEDQEASQTLLLLEVDVSDMVQVHPLLGLLAEQRSDFEAGLVLHGRYEKRPVQVRLGHVSKE